MISKELLSKVFNRKVRTFTIVDNIVYYKYEDIYYAGISGIEDEEINIYELAHKCKEWASINSYALESSVHMQPKRSSVAGCQIHWRYETEDLPYFEADTEPEAIFKAYQYIMENKCGS